MNPITNVLPLVLVLAVSLAKEAFEDRKRAAKDKEVCPASVKSCHAHLMCKLDQTKEQTGHAYSLGLTQQCVYKLVWRVTHVQP